MFRLLKRLSVQVDWTFLTCKTDNFILGSRESTTARATDVVDSLETIPDAVPTVFTEPPVEEQLAWHTLWPESHKLYGHGNELFSLCCNHAGTLVASSCKVRSESLISNNNFAKLVTSNSFLELYMLSSSIFKSALIRCS